MMLQNLSQVPSYNNHWSHPACMWPPTAQLGPPIGHQIMHHSPPWHTLTLCMLLQAVMKGQDNIVPLTSSDRQAFSCSCSSGASNTCSYPTMCAAYHPANPLAHITTGLHQIRICNLLCKRQCHIQQPVKEILIVTKSGPISRLIRTSFLQQPSTDITKWSVCPWLFKAQRNHCSSSLWSYIILLYYLALKTWAKCSN